jgi:NAD(P)-dependent dehydrogenase (short-subunit alcohol dehydrogenase family)
MQNKHIVITGGGRGIGRGLAENFLKEGCKLTINGRSAVTLAETVGELRKVSIDNSIVGVPCDVTDRISMEAFCNQAVSTHGDINIWINNAGIDQKRLSFWEMGEQDYASVFRTNIDGTINGCIVAAAQMMKQGHGRIYNMEGFGSDGRKSPKMSIYGASKRAVSYFTESFALELNGTNVSIGALSPGMVMTDFLRKGLPSDSAQRERIMKAYNILADEVEDVTQFLVRGILSDSGKKRIAWLTTGKVIKRFLLSPFSKRNFFN